MFLSLGNCSSSYSRETYEMKGPNSKDDAAVTKLNRGLRNPLSVTTIETDPQHDEVEMGTQRERLPKLGHSNHTTEPQYEVCEGGVTSNDVVIEENPAYQSVDVAAVKPY